MPAQANFSLVFKELRAILLLYASRLNLKHDTGESYYLDGAYSGKWKREIFFAAAQIKKNYVAFVIKGKP